MEWKEWNTKWHGFFYNQQLAKEFLKLERGMLTMTQHNQDDPYHKKCKNKPLISPIQTFKNTNS